MVHVDHLKLYEGESPVVSWLQGPGTGRAVREDTARLRPESLVPAAAPASPHLPSHSLDVSLPSIPEEPEELSLFTDSEAVVVHPDFADTIPLVVLPNSDLDVTLPYGHESSCSKTLLPNSDLDVTIPYGDADPTPGGSGASPVLGGASNADDDTLVGDAIQGGPAEQALSGLNKSINLGQSESSVEASRVPGQLGRNTATRAGRLVKPKFDPDYVYY